MSGKQFNINVKATSGESPWLNGIVKCHNAVLGKIVNKLTLDENIKYPIDVIITCVVSPKNALHTCYGYSPINLFFERTLIFCQI